jgi:hypothetical protein
MTDDVAEVRRIKTVSDHMPLNMHLVTVNVLSWEHRKWRKHLTHNYS